MKVYLIVTSKPQRVDSNINIFVAFNAKELKFFVCYLRGKFAPLANFQPKWTSKSKVSIFRNFICIMSSPIVPPPSPQNLQLSWSGPLVKKKRLSSIYKGNLINVWAFYIISYYNTVYSLLRTDLD